MDPHLDHAVAFNSANDGSSQDLGAIFVACVRLAQLTSSVEDQDLESRGHLVSAWELREHPLLREMALAPGGGHASLGRYFCAIGLALRRLYADAGMIQEEQTIVHGLAGLGLADRTEGSAREREGDGACPADKPDKPSPPSAAGSSSSTTTTVNGGDGEGCMILLCEGCGVGEPVEEEDRTGGAFYCEDCTKQFETVVAKVRVVNIGMIVCFAVCSVHSFFLSAVSVSISYLY